MQSGKLSKGAAFSIVKKHRFGERGALNMFFYLKKYHAMSAACWQRMRALLLARKNARPNPGFLTQLDRWEADLGLATPPPEPPEAPAASSGAPMSPSAAENKESGASCAAVSTATAAAAAAAVEEAASASENVLRHFLDRPEGGGL
jgi:hypothetical protein